MEIMLAFGFASAMLCLGMFLRAKIPVFRNMLMPASVIAGILGLAFMNMPLGEALKGGVDTRIYTNIE